MGMRQRKEEKEILSSGSHPYPLGSPLERIGGDDKSQVAPVADHSDRHSYATIHSILFIPICY